LQLSDIEDALRTRGLTPRGAFHPEAEDRAPDVTPGVVARTIVLAGHVGPDMWQAFAANGEPEPGSLDPWSEGALSEVAATFGGKAISPFKKPYLPFQRWARRAGPCHPSPLGIFIHPDYGLWHAFRGAIALPEQIDVPAPDIRPSPCDSCEDRRCLSTCPVDAFSEHGLDVRACVGHLVTNDGEDCMALACRARRACPVGRANRYQPAQASFHMAAFLRNRLRASDPHMNNMG
jgi:hypothetical protein